MPSIKKVQDWYAQSFEVMLVTVRAGSVTRSLTCDTGNNHPFQTTIVERSTRSTYEAWETK